MSVLIVFGANPSRKEVVSSAQICLEESCFAQKTATTTVPALTYLGSLTHSDFQGGAEEGAAGVHGVGDGVEYDTFPSPPCDALARIHRRSLPGFSPSRIVVEHGSARLESLVSAEDASLDGLLSWWFGMMEFADRLGL